MREIKKPETHRLKGSFIFSVILILLLSSGCGNKFFDPTQVGRWNHTPAVNVILDSLGVADESPLAWDQGEEPRAKDTVLREDDYKLMPGDILNIYIYELIQQGTPYQQQFIVRETGEITIPAVGSFMVKGMTEKQLESAIRKVLEPDILINPMVSVARVQSTQRTYSILGDGIRAPSRYPILYNDFRLMDALALAQGTIGQDKVSNIYITRQEDQSDLYSSNSKSNNNDFQNIRTPYDLTKKITHDTSFDNQMKRAIPTNKIVVSSTEMVMDREPQRQTNSLEGNNYPQYRRSKPRQNIGRSNPGGTNIYRFSEMPPANVMSQDLVGVNEIIKRLSGNEGPINSVPENTIETNPPVENNYIPPVIETPLNQPIQPEPLNTPAQGESSEQIEWIFQNGSWVPVPVVGPGTGTNNNVTTSDPIGQTSSDGINWQLRDGQWVPVQTNTTNRGTNNQPETSSVQPVRDTEPLQWVDQPKQTRHIKIPVKGLMDGDPRYNIIIKPGDTINVPVDIAGVIYVMGNVNNPGRIQMTGSKMTLKQVVATVGNLGPLAWPKRCEIIRRIGNNKEEIVRVDLEKICNGEMPDFYIKPNDTINIGTHATARWRAILRNAFRATYGFGFVYDRNFADRDFYTSRPFSIF